MTILTGKGVSPGIALGPLVFVEQTDFKAEKRLVSDRTSETARFNAARLAAVSQLKEFASVVADKIGEENIRIFEAHQMMLQDPDFNGFIEKLIAVEGICAEYAVAEAVAEYTQNIEAAGDEYLRSRAVDVRDAFRRVTGILMGVSHILPPASEPAIFAADEFTPSETAQFDRTKVLALVSRNGAANSHAAIFARTMGIPAIIGLGQSLSPDFSGRQAALDGETGTLCIEPDEQTLNSLQEKRGRLREDREALEGCRGKPTVTRSGRKIRLCANIASAADAEAALAGDAEGIGLFRSEFLFLGRSDYPGEDEQYESYQKIARLMQGREVIIRTLDIGADKQASYFGLPPEENPALGMRAIRLCLARPELFKTQLRAIYRASAHGNVAIMFPLISSLEELRQAKAIASEARSELDAKSIPFNQKTPVGIMIETPASVIISDLLAQEADFFSIGTNDLTQYALAMDRQNESVSPFRDTRHEAILRMCRMTVENAHQAGIWAGICGALAADRELTAAFVEMGIDELSVEPSRILPLRKAIRALNAAYSSSPDK
jgi:phosphotransferase system enzyme I (PtsI)